jgi:para-nitrobenzyl esterase
MGATLGSHHSAEIPYVFGNLLNQDNQSAENPVSHPMMVGDWTELDHMLSEAMTAYWTQFSATGDPNREGLTEWPVFTETAQFLRFTDRLEIDTELHTTGFSLYNSYQTARQ